MKDVLPFIIVGITSGSLYGLAGLGLVLTYRTSGIFNFAHGAIAAAAAYAFYDLHHLHGLPWPVALVASVAGTALVLGSALGWLSKQLQGLRTELSIVASIGLLLLIQGFLVWKYGGATLPMRQFLPTRGVTLAGVHLQYAQLIVVGVGAVASLGVYIVLTRTRTGAAMRGLVDDPALVALAGVSPGRTARVAWILGSGLAALSGILIAPVLGLDSVLLTLLVLQAFGAAAIGRFSSLTLTYLGGLAVGILSALATKWGTGRALQGLAPSIPFLVLFMALLVMPTGRIGGTPVAPRFRFQRRWSHPTQWSIAGTGILLLALAPWFADVRLTSYTSALTLVPALLSLGLLVYVAGSISLCHAAFAAVGATTFAHLTTGAGVPWLVALVLAGLAAVPLGALVAIPAIRLSGIYLALATFGFGILLEKVAYPSGMMFGAIGSRRAARPEIWALDGTTEHGFYFVVLAVVLGSVALVTVTARSRLGRLLRALGHSPTALTAQGLSVNVTRVLAFCLSAFLAATTGVLTIAQNGRVGGTGFSYFQSLLWLAVLVVAGRRLVPASFVAAALLVVVPAYLPASFTKYQTMLFGAAAVLATLLPDWDPRRQVAASEERRLRSPVRDRAAERSVSVASPR